MAELNPRWRATMRLRVMVGAGFALATVAGMGWSSVAAQYPAPLGVCTVTPSSTNVQTNSTATLTVTTLLADGKPAAAVPVSVAGGTSGVTGTDGKATLSVPAGTSPGALVVNVTAGVLQCASTLSVVAPRVNPDVIKPPDTGTGVLAETGDSGVHEGLLVAAAAAAAAVAGAGTLAVARRRR